MLGCWCIHACRSCLCMCVHVEVKESSWALLLSYFLHFFWNRVSLSLAWSSPSRLGGLVREAPQIHLFLPPQCWITIVCHHAQLLHEVYKLNSGFCAFKANAVPSELAPIFLLFNYSLDWWIDNNLQKTEKWPAQENDQGLSQKWRRGWHRTEMSPVEAVTKGWMLDLAESRANRTCRRLGMAVVNSNFGNLMRTSSIGKPFPEGVDSI